MITEPFPLLSDPASALSRRANLDDRFRYWRGCSGARYLFSVVPWEALADFRRAAVILAEPKADGGFLAWTGAIIMSSGRIDRLNESWPSSPPVGSIAFVHFLADSDTELRGLLEDLFPSQPAGELKLAA
jgi:hypothetical protein